MRKATFSDMKRIQQQGFCTYAAELESGPQRTFWVKLFFEHLLKLDLLVTIQLIEPVHFFKPTAPLTNQEDLKECADCINGQN